MSVAQGTGIEDVEKLRDARSEDVRSKMPTLSFLNRGGIGGLGADTYPSGVTV